MTESEWLSCRESHEMLGFIRDKATERQLHSFSVACCRRIWQHITDERSRRAVDITQRGLDGQIEDSERLAAARGAADALQDTFLSLDIRRGNGYLYHAAWAAALCSFTPQVPLNTPIERHELSGPFDCAVLIASHSAAANAIAAVVHIENKIEMHSKLDEATKAEYAEQSSLLRAIFGNPCCPAQSGEPLMTT